MRYTKPTIQNESKATPLITSTGQVKQKDLIDSNPFLGPRTDVSAYEADE